MIVQDDATGRFNIKCDVCSVMEREYAKTKEETLQNAWRLGWKAIYGGHYCSSECFEKIGDKNDNN